MFIDPLRAAMMTAEVYDTAMKFLVGEETGDPQLDRLRQGKPAKFDAEILKYAFCLDGVKFYGHVKATLKIGDKPEYRPRQRSRYQR